MSNTNRDASIYAILLGALLTVVLALAGVMEEGAATLAMGTVLGMAAMSAINHLWPKDDPLEGAHKEELSEE